MNRIPLICIVVFQLLCLAGCATHDIEYTPFVHWQMPPMEKAVIIDGETGRFLELSQKTHLPHMTPRERVKTTDDALRELTNQLGSGDYLLLGEVYGSGNSRATLETLRDDLCERASKEGGDVLLIFREGVDSQPYTMVIPGHTSTSSMAAVSRNSAAAAASSSYSPSQFVSGVYYFPYANGFVFRYQPGLQERRQKVLGLDDKQIAAYLEGVNGIEQNENITYEQAKQITDDLLRRVQDMKPIVKSPDGTAKQGATAIPSLP